MLTFTDDLFTLYNGDGTYVGVLTRADETNAIRTSEPNILIPKGGAWWIGSPNNGVRHGSKFTVVENISKSGLLFGTLCVGLWCGGGLTTVATYPEKAPDLNYTATQHFFGKFLNARASWTSQEQAKKLTDYTSTNGYAYTYPITCAWSNSARVNFNSALYVDVSVDNFSNVAWQQQITTLMLDKNSLNNLPDHAWWIYGHLYDTIELDVSPKIYVIQMFVQKGQKLQARWTWNIVGNTAHMQADSSAFFQFLPPKDSGTKVIALPKEAYAQLIQFPNLVVY